MTVKYFHNQRKVNMKTWFLATLLPSLLVPSVHPRMVTFKWVMYIAALSDPIFQQSNNYGSQGWRAVEVLIFIYRNVRQRKLEVWPTFLALTGVPPVDLVPGSLCSIFSCPDPPLWCSAGSLVFILFLRSSPKPFALLLLLFLFLTAAVIGVVVRT